MLNYLFVDQRYMSVIEARVYLSFHNPTIAYFLFFLLMPNVYCLGDTHWLCCTLILPSFIHRFTHVASIFEVEINLIH